MVVLYVNSELISLTDGPQKAFIVQKINNLLKDSSKELKLKLKEKIIYNFK